MNKEGFTLMELLAVIIILAVIALISTPIILNIINDAKAQAELRTIEGYAKAVEYGGLKYVYDHNGQAPTNFTDFSAFVNYQGATVTCSSVNYNDGRVALSTCAINGSSKTYDYSNNEVSEHS